MFQPGTRVFITGSSRGIGAATAELVAKSSGKVIINYRNKALRAEKLAEKLKNYAQFVGVVGADITKSEDIDNAVKYAKESLGGLDVLILNASGGMEAGMPDDYALTLNRDAQMQMLDKFIPIMSEGSRVIFVTSHQAHFIKSVPTMDEYKSVALSKRAGEDSLRARKEELARLGIEFIIVSGDMIEGTVTATLLDRINPGAIESRRDAVGKLYNVTEFANEIFEAITCAVPDDNTKLVGDVNYFLTYKK